MSLPIAMFLPIAVPPASSPCMAQPCQALGSSEAPGLSLSFWPYISRGLYFGKKSLRNELAASGSGIRCGGEQLPCPAPLPPCPDLLLPRLRQSRAYRGLCLSKPTPCKSTTTFLFLDTQGAEATFYFARVAGNRSKGRQEKHSAGKQREWAELPPAPNPPELLFTPAPRSRPSLRA